MLSTHTRVHSMGPSLVRPRAMFSQALSFQISFLLFMRDLGGLVVTPVRRGHRDQADDRVNRHQLRLPSDRHKLS